jgi:hypothetical protein
MVAHPTSATIATRRSTILIEIASRRFDLAKKARTSSAVLFCASDLKLSLSALFPALSPTLLHRNRKALSALWRQTSALALLRGGSLRPAHSLLPAAARQGRSSRSQ